MKRNSENPPKNNRKLVFVIAGILVVVLVSGILILRCTPDKEMVAEAKSFVTDAEDFVIEYRFADAMEKYGEARSVDSGNVDIYTGVAEIYLLKNRRSDAMDVLNKGVEDSRSPGKAYELLGKTLLEDKDFDGAVYNLRKAISSDKSNYSARYFLALAYVNNMDFEKARKYLDIPEDSGEYYVRSQLLRAVLLGYDFDDAEEQLDNLHDIDIDDEALLQAVNDYSNMLDDIKDLDEEESSSKYIDVILAGGALSAGYEDVTINILHQYTEIEEEYWEIYLYLGHAYYLNKEYEKAEETLLIAGTLNPVDYLGPWLLGRVYSEISQENKMIDSYLRSIELSPEEDRINIRCEFAGLLLDGENYIEAEEQYIALESGDGGNKSEYEILLAEISYNRDLIDNAEAILDEIDKASLNDDLLARFYWVKASIYFESGDRKSAGQWIEESIHLDDMNSSYYLLLGQVLFEDEKKDDARDALERAVDLDLNGGISADAVKLLDRI